jgi:predicted lipid-binding transport protein (Tim44 family)
VKTFRSLALIAAVIMALPTVADARVGGGTSKGSRGSHTDQAPPPTQTAPSAKPVERSTTPAQPTQTAQKPATPGAQPGGFFARNPFLSGLMGGMLGAGLIGMMFGGGFGAGLGGAAGFLGLLLQVLLIGGLAYLAVRLFRGWSAQRAQPAYAGGPSPNAGPSPMARTMQALPGGGAASAASSMIAITADDYTAFDSMLTEIQGAYSKGDLAKLRGLVTPEMLGYFSEELSANASRGIENKVEAVKLEQGDLSEAWSEGSLEYATVAMRFSMIDFNRSLTDGRIVEGSDRDRVEATEIWTFLRSRGGKWILSAIQQT